MVRTAASPNVSHYHYYTEITDPSGEVSIEYFMTGKELANKLGVCKKTIYNKMVKDNLKLRYYPGINMKIRKCYIPTNYKVKTTEDQKDMIRQELYDDF